jgi:NADH-quinone oxidoreductase subunit H
MLSTILTILVVFGALQGMAGGLVYFERKVCAYMQNRIGPNRVGPAGLLQILADGIKFMLKEEFVPNYADRVLFVVAPAIGLVAAMLAFSVVPFGATDDPFKDDYVTKYQFIVAKNIDIGILFIFSISSLTVYGIILGGWSSNNKYSLLGGLRSSAQIISYEIPLGLSILGVVLMSGSLNLERIIWRQAEGGLFAWNIWVQPLAFILFMVSAFAECNRLPFDLPETEQELVGGYHTEYNAMKLMFFFLAEYIHMVTTSFLMVILFFGGWHFPGIPDVAILKTLVFLVKMSLFILLFMLVRWTIPRFRFDQLMALAWKVFIPMALLNLIVVMLVMEYVREQRWIMTLGSIAILIGAGLIVTRPQNARIQRLRVDAMS